MNVLVAGTFYLVTSMITVLYSTLLSGRSIGIEICTILHYNQPHLSITAIFA